MNSGRLTNHRAGSKRDRSSRIYGSKVRVTLNLNLVTQSPDVYIYGSSTSKAVNTPHVGEQLLSAEHSAYILHEELEQLEL